MSITARSTWVCGQRSARVIDAASAAHLLLVVALDEQLQLRRLAELRLLALVVELPTQRDGGARDLDEVDHRLLVRDAPACLLWEAGGRVSKVHHRPGSEQTHSLIGTMAW